MFEVQESSYHRILDLAVISGRGPCLVNREEIVSSSCQGRHKLSGGGEERVNG
jgi:hypothetical protein